MSGIKIKPVDFGLVEDGVLSGVLPLLKLICLQTKLPPGFDVDDAFQYCVLKCLKCRHLYDPSISKATTYFGFVAKQFLYKWVCEQWQDQKRFVRLTDDLVATKPDRSFDELEQVDNEDACAYFLGKLEGRNKQIIRLWMRSDYAADIGKRYNLSRERSRQLVNRAIQIMSGSLQSECGHEKSQRLPQESMKRRLGDDGSPWQQVALRDWEDME